MTCKHTQYLYLVRAKRISVKSSYKIKWIEHLGILLAPFYLVRVFFMEKEEIRKDIVGYKGLYQVSNLGRIKDCVNNYIRKNVFHKGNGYMYIGLFRKGKSVSYRIHKLVAIAFISNNLNKPCINHIDLDKTNNKVSNLERCTHSENSYHFNRMKEFNFSEKRKIHLDKIREKTLRQVVQYNIDMEFIKLYNSIVEASILTGISSTSIQNCSSGRSKSAGGYIRKRL